LPSFDSAPSSNDATFTRPTSRPYSSPSFKFLEIREPELKNPEKFIKTLTGEEKPIGQTESSNAV
jgi:hypothetical protein